MSRLRDVLTGEAVTIGGWCGIPASFAAELMGRCGFDWVCIDLQHGLAAYDGLAGMLQALAVTKTPAFVRVPWNQPDYIMKALDAGAQGIIIPMVNTAAEAKAAVDAVKYPPVGNRSWGPLRAQFDVEEYTPVSANRSTILAPMIETREGFANLDEIMAVDGVDAVYVGPSDLGLTHGHVPTLSPPLGSDHEKLILAVLAGSKRHGVIAGIHANSGETARRWAAAGYQMITIASDGALMREAAVREVGIARSGAPVELVSGSGYA